MTVWPSQAESDITGAGREAGFGHQPMVGSPPERWTCLTPYLEAAAAALGEMTGIIQLAGGNEMVIDQDHSAGILDFGKVHFLELFRDKGG